MWISENTESSEPVTQQFAYQALQAEDKIGTMLPCNVIVQELAERKVEVAAIDPSRIHDSYL